MCYFSSFYSLPRSSHPLLLLSLDRLCCAYTPTEFSTCAKGIHPTRFCTEYFLDDHFFRSFYFRFHFGHAILGFRTIHSAIFIPFSVSRSRCIVASAQPRHLKYECISVAKYVLLVSRKKDRNFMSTPLSRHT